VDSDEFSPALLRSVIFARECSFITEPTRFCSDPQGAIAVPIGYSADDV